MVSRSVGKAWGIAADCSPADFGYSHHIQELEKPTFRQDSWSAAAQMGFFSQWKAFTLSLPDIEVTNYSVKCGILEPTSLSPLCTGPWNFQLFEGQYLKAAPWLCVLQVRHWQKQNTQQQGWCPLTAPLPERGGPSAALTSFAGILQISSQKNWPVLEL